MECMPIYMGQDGFKGHSCVAPVLRAAVPDPTQHSPQTPRYVGEYMPNDFLKDTGGKGRVVPPLRGTDYKHKMVCKDRHLH